MYESIQAILDDLAHDPRSDLAAAAHVRSRLDPTAIRAVLLAACRHVVGDSRATLGEATALIAERPHCARIARALREHEEGDFSIDQGVLAARALLRMFRKPTPPLPIAAASVEPLDDALLIDWARVRRENPHEFVYHPRKTDLSAFVVRKFIDDFRQCSETLRRDASCRATVGDLNVTLEVDRRSKSLDLVLGPPSAPGSTPVTPDQVVRAQVAYPRLTLEVKAMMTAHRQSTSRFIDELLGSLDVVKAERLSTIAVLVVVVNVSEFFTNPVRLPGPNKSKPREITKLINRIVERIPLDGGSGRDKAYGAIAIAVVDTDNEKRLVAVDRSAHVPETHSYGVAVARVAALYDRLTR